MKITTVLAVFIVAAIYNPANAINESWMNPALSADQRAAEIVKAMTLEEKVGETMLVSEFLLKTPEQRHRAFAVQHVGALLQFNGVKTIRALQAEKLAASRLKIPLMFHEDVIHGYRTVHPVPLASACSWDTNLVARAEAAVAREAAACGLNLAYAPMVDISRDPRWGRIVETNGEDPFLASAMAAARIRGMQGDDLARPDTVMACVKHFFGYASMEGGIDYSHYDFSRRTAEELYLEPYRAAIAAGVGSVMCDYTSYNGVPLTFSPDGRDLLRHELGFDGLYMTDWKNLNNCIAMGVSASESESARRALVDGGLDMDMTSCFYSNLVTLVRSGKVPESAVDAAARRCLAAKFKMGLFDDPYRYLDETREAKEVLSTANRAMSREMAEASMVLLKNADRALPLLPGEKVRVAGEWADNGRNQLGSWARQGKGEESVTVQAALQSAGLLDDAATTAIACIGEPEWYSGEWNNVASITLPTNQIPVLRQLRAQGAKKVVAVVFCGRPVILKEVLELADAVLVAWYPGTMGGEAVTRILTGAVNPSAKLCQTFPRSAAQIPIYYARNRVHADTPYRDIDRTPEFPFGFGLSYTTFKYDTPAVAPGPSKTNAPVRVTCRVTNTGKVAGREVVQLYRRIECAPTLQKERELRGFQIVSLQPGESKDVVFDLPPSAFAYLAHDLKRAVAPGEYTIFVGPDSATKNSVKVVLTK